MFANACVFVDVRHTLSSAFLEARRCECEPHIYIYDIYILMRG